MVRRYAAGQNAGEPPTGTFQDPSPGNAHSFPSCWLSQKTLTPHPSPSGDDGGARMPVSQRPCRKTANGNLASTSPGVTEVPFTKLSIGRITRVPQYGLHESCSRERFTA